MLQHGWNLKTFGKWNKSFTKGQRAVWFHSYEVLNSSQIYKHKNRMEVASRGVKRNGERIVFFFHVYTVSVLQNKISSGYWLHKNVNGLNTTELYA